MVVASEALASGRLTRHELRTRYVKLHRDVHAPRGLELTALDRAVAAWLWCRGDAILVGPSAAAALGTRWLSADEPAELARPRTKVSVAQIKSIAERYPGARGVRQFRAILECVDGGAESPQETRLRLLLVTLGLPRPVTQIPVRNERGKVVRRIDMGYPEHKVGVEYDGEQHFTNTDDYADDIERLEFLAARGWIIVRVSARQLRYERRQIGVRVRAALAAAAAQ